MKESLKYSCDTRVKQIQECLKYIEEHPNAWQELRDCCYESLKTYLPTLNTHFCVYNHIPARLLKADEFLLFCNKWEKFKKEWYKDLASNYQEAWLPISDFTSGDDEVFVDTSDARLPVLVVKFLFRNDFLARVGCVSLIQFIAEYKRKVMEREKNEVNSKCIDNMAIIQAFAEAWTKKDALLIEPFLAPDFHYASQWVLSEITTSTEYLKYLEDKFMAIKRTNSEVNVRIIPNTNGIEITQMDGDIKRVAVLVVDVRDGLAHRADLCMPTMAFLKTLK